MQQDRPVNPTFGANSDLRSDQETADALESANRWNGVDASSRREAWGEVFDDARSLTERGMRQITMFGLAGVEAGVRAFGDPDFNIDILDTISPEEANERFGVDGYLTFDAPVTEALAEERSYWANRQAYREWAVASSELPLLDQLGAGLLGSLTDPLQLPLWLAPEAAVGNTLRGAFAARGLGPIARGAASGAVEGAAGGLLYEGLNVPLRRASGEDYGLAEASVSVLGGALFGGAVGGVLGRFLPEPSAAARAAPDLTPEPLPAGPLVPEPVARLRPETRVGAAREAIEAVMDDRALDLGPALRQAEAWDGSPSDLARLDETAGPLPAGWRALDSDVAVTTRGQEIPVRYALVELDDLTTSHTDDLFRDPAYPPELQPRQRERAAAQARNRKLEGEMNPLRLMDERGAESGAPIVSREGVVESGNGRTIALRRSSRGSGTEAYAKYRALLESRGLDLKGFERPVLVRVREEALSGAERARLTRDMNADVTERYSATEQAMADAQALDDGIMGLLEGGDALAAVNRPFQRRFLERVAGDQINSLFAPGGGLSKQGEARVRAALTARAYGDEGLVEALFEAGDDALKGIGQALADAAPAWSAMKAAMARGEVPADLDMTGSLILAVDFVRHARSRRIPMADLVAQRLGQLDAFSGDAVSPETEGFLRAMFNTGKDGATLWNRPRAADKLAEALRWLADETRKVQPGPNLFGEVADAADARRLVDGLNTWFARNADPEQHPLLLVEADDAAVGDVRAAGRQGAGGGGRPDAGGAAARGEGLEPDPRPAGHDSPFAWHPSYGTPAHWAEFQRTGTNLATRQRYKGLYGVEPESRAALVPDEATLEPPPATRIDVGDPFADDPELNALWRDTEAMVRREGLEGETGLSPDETEVSAAGIEAAANCMLDWSD